MRRFVFATLLSASLMPGWALAQSAPNPPPGPMQGPGSTPPGPAGRGPSGPGGHDHGPGGWGHNKFAQRLHWQFNAANTTHDGHLTLAQAKAADLDRIIVHFADIDTAKRGYVTFNEVEAWNLDNMAKHLEKKAAELRAAD